MQDSVANLTRRHDAERKRLVIEHKQKALEAKIAELKAEFEIERREMEDTIDEADSRAQSMISGRIEAGRQREGTTAVPGKTRKGGRK